MRIYFRVPAVFPALTTFLITCLGAPTTVAQAPQIFRLDGGRSTYAFGVNERGELQSLYWGGRLGREDKLPRAHSLKEWASFDSSYTNTPGEYERMGRGIVYGTGAENDLCRWQSRLGTSFC